MPVGLLDVGRDLALAFRVHVVVGAGHLVATLGNDALRLGEGDTRERGRRNRDLNTPERLDLGAVLVLDGLEAGDEKLFVELHNVFVAVDPADLGVNTGELGGVTARERGVGAERGSYLEDFAEARGLRHLLEELGALREVGEAVEVVDLKQLGLGLAGAGHEFRGVQLDEVVLDPVGAPGVLECGLDLEDQGVFGNAQVEEAPVHTLVDTTVVGDGGLGDGARGDLDSLDLDLDTAELDALVVLELTGDGEEAALAERGDLVGDGVFRRRLVLVEETRVHKLHRARLIAQHNELHLLLIAYRFDPTGYGDGAVVARGKVFNEGACSHNRRVYSEQTG